MTHILHTATCMISNVEGVLWVDKERRIGNFKLGYKNKKDVTFIMSRALYNEVIWIAEGVRKRDLPHTVWMFL